MALLPPIAQVDPTLEAADAALVAKQRMEERRRYVGFSSIGHTCERLNWYRFHTDHREVFDAATIRRFESGHQGEDIMASRLRAVPGVTLLTANPDTGRQWRFEDPDMEGKFAGHADGVILGLLQSPKTWHVWEHKQTNPKKFAELAKLKASEGEKGALKKWDLTYYGQGMLYCFYSGITRHYLTCSTPGERETISVRTNEDPEHAMMLRDRAKRIINARAPLAKISNNPAWYVCRFCSFHGVCHGSV